MTAAAIAQPTTSMRAVVHDLYGRADVLELKEVEAPELPDDRVLVRVRAVSLNKLDWYDVSGTPLLARAMTGLRRPKVRGVGHDFSGTVEAVGKDVHGLAPGDEVFGAGAGALAELVRARDGWVARKPVNLSFEEASAVPIAALTALQGLRDRAQLGPGQTILIIGASGGVGTFAVQIAKALGAEVTAVCSTRNVEQARALGADHVVDYTKDDVSRSGRRFDAILHVGGRMSMSQFRRLLAPNGKLVLAGASTGSRVTGPLAYLARIKVASWLARRHAAFYVAKFNAQDMDALRELIESGHVQPVVEKVYGLTEVADAVRYLGEGHARGKLVVSL